MNDLMLFNVFIWKMWVFHGFFSSVVMGVIIGVALDKKDKAKNKA